MSALPAAVVLVLVVKELLVPGVLHVQRALGVGGKLVLVGAAAAQTAVVQRQTVPLVVCHELKQRRTDERLEQDTRHDVDVSFDRCVGSHLMSKCQEIYRFTS